MSVVLKIVQPKACSVLDVRLPRIAIVAVSHEASLLSTAAEVRWVARRLAQGLRASEAGGHDPTSRDADL